MFYQSLTGTAAGYDMLCEAIDSCLSGNTSQLLENVRVRNSQDQQTGNLWKQQKSIGIAIPVLSILVEHSILNSKTRKRTTGTVLQRRELW